MRPANGQGLPATIAAPPGAPSLALAARGLYTTTPNPRPESSNDVLIVGRGVPNQWLTPGNTISVANFPTTDGKRLAVTIATGDHSVTLTLNGSPSAGAVLLQLPVFVDNIATSSAGTIVQQSGTVRLSAHEQTVTVRLLHAPA